MSETREVHVERLLGRRVRDARAEMVGRIEELTCDLVGPDAVVREVHLGPAALAERFGAFAVQLPFLRTIPFERWEYRVPWPLVDLADPDRPRLRCAKADLDRQPPERGVRRPAERLARER